MPASRTSIGEFVRPAPERYAGLRLRDLCAEMHAFFRDSAVSTLQRAQFAPEHLPTLVMPPHEAVRRAGAQPGRLRAARPGRRPDRHDAVRGLSARHRHHRAGRTPRRAGAADARLSRRCSSGAPICFPASRPKSRASIARSRQDGTVRFYTYVVRANSRRRLSGSSGGGVAWRPRPGRAASARCRSSARIEADAFEQADALRSRRPHAGSAKARSRHRYRRSSGESPPPAQASIKAGSSSRPTPECR